jgi:hypothetical protein
VRRCSFATADFNRFCPDFNRFCVSVRAHAARTHARIRMTHTRTHAHTHTGNPDDLQVGQLVRLGNQYTVCPLFTLRV